MDTAIRAFFGSEAYAIVGVSRSGKKFGNTIFREMYKKHYRVFPVHALLDSLEGVRCVPNVTMVPDSVRSVIIAVRPDRVVPLLEESVARGIRNVWLQQGAESNEAVDFAVMHDLNLVHGRCVLMFLEPVKSIHAFHRWVDRLRGAYPN